MKEKKNNKMVTGKVKETKKVTKIQEKNVKAKVVKPKENKFKEFLKKIITRNLVIAFVTGLVVGLIVMALCMPKRIAKLSNGEEVIVTYKEASLTADTLYKDIKAKYTPNVLNLILDRIDDELLTELYPENSEMKTAVKNMADYYISMYESYYGYSESEFLEVKGFENKNEFLKVLTLEYRRNEYLNKYTKDMITENEINKYYNDNIFGDIEAKYIEASTKEGLELANKVIARLNNGETYESIVNYYGDRVTAKDLGFVSYNSEVDETIVKALKSLKDNSYTTNAVKVNDKYVVVLRYSSKEKAKLEDIKDTVITAIAKEKQAADSNLLYKALIELRKNNNISFKDTGIAKSYEEYVKSYKD